jgi:hypothetical protein
MYTNFQMQVLTEFKHQSMEGHAAQKRLCKAARAGRPGIFSQLLDKIAVGLIAAGEGLRAFGERKAILNS